jgi:hypothetical protein
MRIDTNARIIIKTSTVSGETATLAPLSVNGTYDHTLLPAWSPSDVYIGEFFINEPDEKLWIRLNSTTIKRILLEGETPGVTQDVPIIGLSGGTGLRFENGLFIGIY